MDERLFRATIAGIFFTVSLGVSIFILFPTYVVQPQLTGTDILSKLLLSIQIVGGDHDALPSAHIYTSVVLALFYRDWYPRYKWVWLLIVVIVSLSTLFTNQHYIADVLAGYLTA
jgi:membrane-associated phospholipid phosphatase